MKTALKLFWTPQNLTLKFIVFLLVTFFHFMLCLNCQIDSFTRKIIFFIWSLLLYVRYRLKILLMQSGLVISRCIVWILGIFALILRVFLIIFTCLIWTFHLIMSNRHHLWYCLNHYLANSPHYDDLTTYCSSLFHHPPIFYLLHSHWPCQLS